MRSPAIDILNLETYRRHSLPDFFAVQFPGEQ